VSTVENFAGMFESSKFSRDLSSWNPVNAKDMSYMFFNCEISDEIEESIKNTWKIPE
jgi:hypothetical protein